VPQLLDRVSLLKQHTTQGTKLMTMLYNVTYTQHLNMAGGSRTYEQDAGDFYTREEAGKVAAACGGTVTEWQATPEALSQLYEEGTL
jgi:hypothetical protein